MTTTRKTYRARYVPVALPFKHCCATGCGDKIKETNERVSDDASNGMMIEVVNSSTGEVFYLEPICVDWFENGHPDYGHPIGELVWEAE